MEPKMLGESIVGYVSYHYKYKIGHERDAILVGFSPRKARISLYFSSGFDKRDDLLKKFGKHKTGKACVYVNKLEDIDTNVLKELINESINFYQNFMAKKILLENKDISQMVLKLSSD